MKGIRLEKVGKRFGDFWAVRNVSCNIREGRITGFVGPNGAGKTTLFHLITGELKPNTGHIYFYDKDITGKPPWWIARKGIGKLFQDVRIFKNLTVLENVIVSLLQPREESPIIAWKNIRSPQKLLKMKEDDALHWLEFVGLVEHRKRMASDLSFGQQKLLSIARLLAGGFKYLLLDEPTAGVHPKMIRKIEELLHRLVEEQGVTIAIIEHNMSVIMRIARWVYFMDEGRIALGGLADDVLGNKEVREIYIGL